MICKKCGKDKPYDSFGWKKKNKEKQDICKECFSAYNRKRYIEKKEEIKAMAKKYRDENPEKVFESLVKQFNKNPSKILARKIINSAVKAGIILKPDKCSICGCANDEHRIEAHHDDYKKPLDIVWICTPCHRALDFKRREKAGHIPCVKSKKTKKLSLSGEVLEVFNSRKEAAKSVGVSSGRISDAVNRGETSAGYRWSD